MSSHSLALVTLLCQIPRAGKNQKPWQGGVEHPWTGDEPTCHHVLPGHSGLSSEAGLGPSASRVHKGHMLRELSSTRFLAELRGLLQPEQRRHWPSLKGKLKDLNWQSRSRSGAQVCLTPWQGCTRPPEKKTPTGVEWVLGWGRQPSLVSTAPCIHLPSGLSQSGRQFNLSLLSGAVSPPQGTACIL